MIINNIVKDLETKRSKAFARLERYNNRYHRDTLHRNKQTKELVGYDTMAPVNNLVVRLVDSNNRPYSSIGLCNNSQWTYYALFHPCFISSACFDYPNNKACKVFNFSQFPINSAAKI